MKLFEENEMNSEKWAKAKKILTWILGVILGIYISVAWYYADRFFMGTTVNGLDCSGKKVEQVEALLQSEIEKYELSIEAEGVEVQQIQGAEIDIAYSDTESIEEAMKKHNTFIWPKALFEDTKIETKVNFEYDEEKLEQLVSALLCMKEEKQVEAVAAMPEYDGKQYVIKAEQLGTQIDTEKLNAAVIESIQNMKPILNLREAECYLPPSFTSESKEVIAAVESMNQCLKTKITYQLDSKTVTLDADLIHEMLSVDGNMKVLLSEEAVKEFVKTLSETYNTEPRTRYIVTPTGKSAYVASATKGRKIGTQEECEKLLEDIPKGKVEKREPIVAQKATPEGQYSWGRTYVEVDISAQHMWYIKNGEVIFNSAVVTGSPGRDTPAGVFEILTKKRDKILRGNIDPVTGEREYETPVDYWARITWSGVGFHDATWQPAFGGQLYKQGYGSHGCINMPYSAVAKFYSLISVGDPVVIHY